ncbi:phage head-tail joining protein [uncultured Cohaesibacter sp.]|uniref:phage head-tail joining protein n=1 Tax=uncultured Cohaesibacter sp. TaxID=1002546 RepID=UPI0029C75962|nr:hypothetical protein [uncultured Cohaesibacter sp.]
MAFTNDDLATLDKAIASGIKSVTYSDGRVVTYQSLADMIAAKKYIQEEVLKASGTGRTYKYLTGVRRG